MENYQYALGQTATIQGNSSQFVMPVRVRPGALSSQGNNLAASLPMFGPESSPLPQGNVHSLSLEPMTLSTCEGACMQPGTLDFLTWEREGSTASSTQHMRAQAFLLTDSQDGGMQQRGLGQANSMGALNPLNPFTGASNGLEGCDTSVSDEALAHLLLRMTGMDMELLSFNSADHVQTPHVRAVHAGAEHLCGTFEAPMRQRVVSSPRAMHPKLQHLHQLQTRHTPLPSGKGANPSLLQARHQGQVVSTPVQAQLLSQGTPVPHQCTQAAAVYASLNSAPTAATMHMPGMVPVPGTTLPPRSGSGPLYIEMGKANASSPAAVLQQGGMSQRQYISKHNSLPGPAFMALTQAAAARPASNFSVAKQTRFQQAGGGMAFQPLYMQQAAAAASIGRAPAMGSHHEDDWGEDSPAAVQRALAAASVLLSRQKSVSAQNAVQQPTTASGNNCQVGACGRSSFDESSTKSPVSGATTRIVYPGAGPVEDGRQDDGRQDAAVGEDGQEISHSRHKLYKTDVCRNWLQTGTCKYEEKCQFAHSAHELRPRKNRVGKLEEQVAVATAAERQWAAAAAALQQNTHEGGAVMEKGSDDLTEVASA